MIDRYILVHNSHKENKYLGINLTNEVKDLNDENSKSLKRLEKLENEKQNKNSYARE